MGITLEALFKVFFIAICIDFITGVLVAAKDGSTWLKCKSGYYVNKKYMEFVRYV